MFSLTVFFIETSSCTLITDCAQYACSVGDPDNLICFFRFLPDCNESLLLSPHRTWTVIDLPLHLSRNILPFQVCPLKSFERAL